MPNSVSGSATRVDVTMSGHPTTGYYNRIYFGNSGWKEGLPLGSEDCVGTNCSILKRWTTTAWDQDQYGYTAHSYRVNPRVVNTEVGDGTNTKGTTITYHMPPPVEEDPPSYYTLYGLVDEVRTYETTSSNVRVKTKTDYNFGTTYLNKRVIGLPSKVESWGWNSSGGGSLEYVSKVTYAYDEGNLTGTDPVQNISPVQHSNLVHSSNYVTGRGNLTSVTRWDASSPTNSGAAVTSSMKYNTAGSVVARIDPLGRTTKISYADHWNDSTTRTTYAYPTQIKGPDDSYYSSLEYRYDTGANVWSDSPVPVGQTSRPISSRTYNDTTGRIEKETMANGAYTEYEFADSGNALTTYKTLVDVGSSGVGPEDEVTTRTEFDGAGRVWRTRTENPGSTGGWTAVVNAYDKLGRAVSTSVPTEVSVSDGTWTASGDDYPRGFVYNKTGYDWKGRPTITIPSDSTTNLNGSSSDGKETLISYAGCGCAGGQVTTIQGPAVLAYSVGGTLQTTAKRRVQKVYEDTLGRKYKTEQWDLDGAGTAPYSTTKTLFNGRDQSESILEYAGFDTSTTVQETTMSYDGHGRLYQKHLPQWFYSTSAKYETRTYNVDDTVASLIDPRGTTTTYTYGSPSSTEKRPLVTKVEYAPPSPNPTPPDNKYVPDVPDVTFTYDAAGNRSQMMDGTGTLDYEYDQLSRLKKETKDFADTFTASPPSGGYFLEYEYHLSGSLKSIEDPFGQITTYAADKAGRLTEIGDQSSSTAYASAISHRAFGGIKSMVMSTGSPTTLNVTYDNALRPATYSGANATAGTIQEAAYVYHNDGLMKDIDNTAEPEFDQESNYDFAGRLRTNQAGPLTQNLQYDAFSNLTIREDTFWGLDDRFEVGYTNNRKSWSTVPIYDASDTAGNVVQSVFAPYTPNGDRPYNDLKWWTFDAAGRTTYFSQFTSASGTAADAREAKHDIAFDGDGRPVIENTRERPCSLATSPAGCTGTWVGLVSHYLISSVTGQKITTLYDGANGEKHVYMGQTKIASYAPPDSVNPAYMSFTLTDPVTGSSAVLESDGTADLSNRTELAALGTAVPTSSPPQFPIPLHDENGFAGDAEFGCKDEYGNFEPCMVTTARAQRADDFAGRKWKKPARKVAVSLRAFRNEKQLVWSSPEKGASMGLAASGPSAVDDPDGGFLETSINETVEVRGSPDPLDEMADASHGVEGEPATSVNGFCWSINNLLTSLGGYMTEAFKETTKDRNERGGVLAVTTGGKFELYNYPVGGPKGVESLPTQREVRNYGFVDSLVIAFHTHPTGGGTGPSGVAGSANYGDYGVINHVDYLNNNAKMFVAPPFGIVKWGPNDNDITVYGRKGIIKPTDYDKKVGCWFSGEGS